MAKKKSNEVEMTEEEKIAAWLKKNKIKRIPINVGGEQVVRSFFVRRGKKKKPAKTA